RPAGFHERAGDDVLGQAVQPVRPRTLPVGPARSEVLVGPPAHQQGFGAQRLVELDLGPGLSVLDADPVEPAAADEAVLAGRVLGTFEGRSSVRTWWLLRNRVASVRDWAG